MLIPMKKLMAPLIVIHVFLCSPGCRKYEEGPLLSFRSKEERVANDWRVTKAMDGSRDVTGDFEKYEISLTRSGLTTLSAKYRFLGATYEYTTQGTWAFVSNKEKITLNYEDDSADGTYLILLLREEELWVREEGTNLELHLVPR